MTRFSPRASNSGEPVEVDEVVEVMKSPELLDTPIRIGGGCGEYIPVRTSDESGVCAFAGVQAVGCRNWAHDPAYTLPVCNQVSAVGETRWILE